MIEKAHELHELTRMNIEGKEYGVGLASRMFTKYEEYIKRDWAEYRRQSAHHRNFIYWQGLSLLFERANDR